MCGVSSCGNGVFKLLVFTGSSSRIIRHLLSTSPSLVINDAIVEFINVVNLSNGPWA